MISKREISSTINLYKESRLQYLDPLYHIFNTISLRIILLFLKTRLAVKYRSIIYMMPPLYKHKILIETIPSYRSLEILYLYKKCILSDFLEYLEKIAYDIPRSYFLELILIMTTDKEISELVKLEIIPLQIAALCKALNQGEPITIYNRESYKMSVKTEYNILYNLIHNTCKYLKYQQY